jgi:hypothetical protein
MERTVSPQNERSGEHSSIRNRAARDVFDVL